MAMTLIETPPTALAAAPGVNFGLLNRKHKDYDEKLYEKLRLLYEGGFEILKHAREFVPKVPREGDNDYEWRLMVTSYINYLAQVVGYVTGALFNVPIEVVPEGKEQTPDKAFYEEFARNVDLEGTPFSQFVRSVTSDALVFKRAIIALDMPRSMNAINLAEEEAAGGGRAYMFRIPVADLINWEKSRAIERDPGSDFGAFQWCVLKRRVESREDPFALDSKYKYEFKVWQQLPEFAQFSVYETKRVDSDVELHDEDRLEETVPATPTSFKRIPVRELELPKPLWAGDQAGPLCIEHYRLRNDLTGSMGRALVEIPYIKRGSEIGAMHGALPSETQQNPMRGENPVRMAREKGFVALGSDDDIGFAGPSGRAFEISRQCMAEVRDEIFRTVHTMALSFSNTAAALGRSGESKREDRSATAVMLDYLGDSVRGFAKTLYQIVSEARGEKTKWTANGLDTFDDDDRLQTIEEAVQVQTLDIPSPAFHRLYKKQVALTLVRKAASKDKQAISDEIEKNVSDEDVLAGPTPAPGPEESPEP